MRQIKLTKQEADSRLVVVASEAIDMANEVFTFLRKPLNPLDSSGILDQFVNVSTLVELESLPINGPDQTISNKFRMATLDLAFSTDHEVGSAWEEIVLGVSRLVDDLNQADRLKTDEVIVVS